MRRSPKRCHYETDWPPKYATAILLARANSVNENAIIYPHLALLSIARSLRKHIVCSVRISQHV